MTAVEGRADEVRAGHLTQPEVLAACADGLVAGRLLLPYCAPCGVFLHQWFNRCSEHWSVPIEIREVPGEGTIWSWVRYHRQYRLPSDQQAPYVVVCIDLDTGPRTYANLADGGHVTPGRGVRVHFNGDLSSTHGHLVFDALPSADGGRPQSGRVDGGSS
jgi:uncharacterized protein